MTFLMAGGGTGGHVIPALAVARELRRRGHDAYFVGTRTGLEARLAPAQGFAIDWIEIGGLKRVGWAQRLRTLAQLPVSAAEVRRSIDRRRPAAVFSMGGYVAGPVMLAAWRRKTPVVIMEPNAMPGLVNRRAGRIAARALISFPETARWFPAGRAELTGLPVRDEFFRIAPKPRGGSITVLITGGSQGSRTLNRAARDAWEPLSRLTFPVGLIHQTGRAAYDDLKRDFDAFSLAAGRGLDWRIEAFIDDMPSAIAEADIVVCRAGAGAVAELAAAGRPSILVPFPHAADDHQTRNAQAFAGAGAARMVADSAMTGSRLIEEIRALVEEAGALERMSGAARAMARPGAAQRAADLLEEFGRRYLDSEGESRNNT